MLHNLFKEQKLLLIKTIAAEWKDSIQCLSSFASHWCMSVDETYRIKQQHKMLSHWELGITQVHVLSFVLIRCILNDFWSYAMQYSRICCLFNVSAGAIIHQPWTWVLIKNALPLFINVSLVLWRLCWGKKGF